MLLIGLMGSVLLSAGAQAASFDCGRATTADERAVCADRRLSELDSVAASAFESARQAVGGTEAVQVGRDFMSDRRKCGGNPACIMASYVAVIGEYAGRGGKVGVPAWADAAAIAAGTAQPSASIPALVGQCVVTQIARVMPRLDPGRAARSSDFDSGIGVDYDGGGHQVTYERQEAILRSRPGDEVVLCLISVPHQCPPGDDRGRVYATTNLRTRASWSLPDSQHSCGGA